MSNEEWALEIQQGNKVAETALWVQMKGLLYRLVFQYYNRLKGRCEACGVSCEDLQQESYFALMDAVKAYKPDKGYKLNTYLNYATLNRFNALTGNRTNRQRGEPLNQCTSLNVPVGEDESAELSDLVEDSGASERFEDAEHRVYLEQLHNTLEQVMDDHLTTEQRDVIQRRYYDGLTLREVGEVTHRGTARVRQIEGQALRKLREPHCARPLLPFSEQVMGMAYHSSFTAYRHAMASTTELIVERVDQWEHEHQRKASYGQRMAVQCSVYNELEQRTNTERVQ